MRVLRNINVHQDLLYITFEQLIEDGCLARGWVPKRDSPLLFYLTKIIAMNNQKTHDDIPQEENKRTLTLKISFLYCALVPMHLILEYIATLIQSRTLEYIALSILIWALCWTIKILYNTIMAGKRIFKK